MPEVGETRKLSELGLVSRRTMLKGGAAVAAGAGLAATVGSKTAQAGIGRLAPANARRVGDGQFTGWNYTRGYSVPYTDLCIPVGLSDGSLLLIGGDSYNEDSPAQGKEADWRAPIGLRSHSNPLAGKIEIDGAVLDDQGVSHAKGLVPEGHEGHPPYTTALPSDIFRVGDTLYMHLMRGYIYDTHHSDFWKSTDNGENWTYLRQWPGDMYPDVDSKVGQFQQKTYAADTDPLDPYVYVMSTAFNRDADSGLLLFRVLKSDLDKTDEDAANSGWGPKFAYQGWGFANGQWAWGNEPTTVVDRRKWGEICFRAMGGKYALSWFQPTPHDWNLADIRAMVFPLPTSNLFETTEQTMVYMSGANPASDPDAVQRNLYGGFIFPGSTFDNFNIAVSNWDPNAGYHYEGNDSNYVVSQWRTRLNPDI